jgi:hypothetical protein
MLQYTTVQYSELCLAILARDSNHVSASECWSDIFRPQTRRFGEITVLYTQLVDEKLEVYCVRVRIVETMALFLSNECIKLVLAMLYIPKLSKISKRKVVCSTRWFHQIAACLRSKDVASNEILHLGDQGTLVHLYQLGTHRVDLKVYLIPVEDIPPQAIPQLWPPNGHISRHREYRESCNVAGPKLELEKSISVIISGIL